METNELPKMDPEWFKEMLFQATGKTMILEKPEYVQVGDLKDTWHLQSFEYKVKTFVKDLEARMEFLKQNRKDAYEIAHFVHNLPAKDQFETMTRFARGEWTMCSDDWATTEGN